MSAGIFILILVVAIAALVLMIVKAKMHPVLALFIAALGTGIALGYGVTGSVDYISNGFGGTLGSVGITNILGAIISMAIEDTGAAKVIANFFIKLFRGKRMELAPALTAFIMSIPVFGDITMVLTAPIASMLSKRKHISMSTMASFTGLGLFLTHGLVPPTPGILAIALMFGSDLGMTIVWGLVISFVGFCGSGRRRSGSSPILSSFVAWRRPIPTAWMTSSSRIPVCPTPVRASCPCCCLCC